MGFNSLKQLLPDRPTITRVYFGPLRGARILLNPRNSLRKIFGIYEHELNPWLDAALRRSVRVIDVGANDGYFTFGCAAAFRRLNKSGEIVAFEPDATSFKNLQETAAIQRQGIQFSLINAFAGRENAEGVTTLDSIRCKLRDPDDRKDTLIKIDVEGAEEEVIAGASSWLKPGNSFLIEVHRRSFLSTIPKYFAERQVHLDLVPQRTLRLIGGETRSKDNWWLASRPGVL